MQKIQKGLQQKINLINKIKNNLKIKKYDLPISPNKTKIDLPSIQKHQQLTSTNQYPPEFSQQSAKSNNEDNQSTLWINIKRISNNNKDFDATFSNRQTSKSFDDKILISTFTSRFGAKNGLMKVVQLKSLMKDKSNKNISAEFLRKTFLQKNSRTFSSDKQEKNKLTITKPQQDLTFYGKINSTNHVSGIRFKTLDPRFGGLTRDELKQKIKKREISQSEVSTMQPPTSRGFQARNLYELNLSYNTTGRERQSSFRRYNNLSYEYNADGQRRSRRGKQSHSKDRYSPWNQNSQQILWDELPKIK